MASHKPENGGWQGHYFKGYSAPMRLDDQQVACIHLALGACANSVHVTICASSYCAYTTTLFVLTALALSHFTFFSISSEVVTPASQFIRIESIECIHSFTLQAMISKIRELRPHKVGGVS